MGSFSLSGGVEVMGFISPTNPLDEYPVIDPLYGIDGFRNVNLLSDLDNIPNLRRRAGMVVGVSGGTQYYKLNPEPWNSTISDWTLFQTGGGGGEPFTGGTVSGETIFTNGVTATTISASTYLGLPLDIYVTGGTYNDGVTTFINNTGGTFNVSGYYTGETDNNTFTTGFTYENNTFTIFDNSGNSFNATIDVVTGLTINGTLSASTYENLPLGIYGTGLTFNTNNYDLSLDGQNGTLDTISLSILASDLTVTGGTYDPNTGIATFTNNTGGTFNVTGFLTGMTDTFVTGSTYNNNTFTFTNTSGGSFSVNFNTITGLTSTGTISSNTISATTYQNLPDNVVGNYLPLSGGTVTGNTLFSQGLTASTISASTYQNLPVTADTFTTGFSYSNNTFTINRNQGQPNLTATIDTMSGLTVNGNLTTTTISGGTLYGDGSNLTGISAGLNVGVTQITNGTSGRVLFQSGTTIQQSASLFWDNTNARLGVGATPASTVRLDVRAQGALSTDIAFRVRNSADNGNLFTSLGSAQIIIGTSTTTPEGQILARHEFGSAQPILTLRNGQYGNLIFQVRDERTTSPGSVGSFRINGIINGGESGTTKRFDLGGHGLGASYGDNAGNSVWLNDQGSVGDGTGSSVISVSSNFYINRQTVKVFKFIPNVGNFGVNVMTFGTSATNTIAIANGVAPTTSPADAIQFYSADITAGNAAPHFRTENGSIVKLYQETTGVTTSTLINNAGTTITDTDTFDGYTLQQIVKALRNLGVLQ